jgi:hypothetical protein
MWRDGFPRATIVGVDIEIPAINLGARVHVVQGDRDREPLESDSESRPDGFLVITMMPRTKETQRPVDPGSFVDHFAQVALHHRGLAGGLLRLVSSPVTVAAR